MGDEQPLLSTSVDCDQEHDPSGHNKDGDVKHPPSESSGPLVELEQGNGTQHSNNRTEQSHTDQPDQRTNGQVSQVNDTKANGADDMPAPGGYMVTRSQEKEAAARQQAFEQTKLLQVEFFLYAPEIDDYSACEAVLCVSDNGQSKNYPLWAIDEKILWTTKSPVYLPVDKETRYKYSVLYKAKTSFFQRIFNVRKDMEACWVHEVAASVHDTQSIHRDIFKDPNVFYKDEEFYGKLFFTEDIFNAVTFGNLKEKLLEWEYLQFPNTSLTTKEERKEILGRITKLSWRATKVQKAFLCVVLGKMSQQSGFHLKKLEVATAKSLLQGLSGLTVEDLPSTCIGGLKIMVPQLLSAADTVEPWLWLLGNCSKLFETGYLIQQATSQELKEWSKKHTPAQYMEHSNVPIYNLIHTHPGGSHRDRLLVAIQREAPDIDTKIAIFDTVAGDWQAENLQEVLEPMKLNCTASVENAIRSLKGPKQVEELYQLWRKVERMGLPVEDMIASAVTQLAAKSSFPQDQITKLQMLMTDRKLFSSKKALDLFKVIAASKDPVFQSMFLALAHDEKMSQVVDKEDAKELSVMWLQTSIDAHCTTSRMSYQPSVVASLNIQRAYDDLLKVMGTVLVGHDQTIERALGEVVKGFIRKFGWKVMLKKCEDMKNMSEQAQGLYKEHLEEMIKQEGSAQLSEDLLEIAYSICDMKHAKAPGGLDIKYK
ncbi:uncharacterized protein LOC118413659 [Branchiostoma floridae]|uniref:Uncharacterized protein LOC118413659 n=1 Tax=Branchiostoma floridae TaxID=7739 RepID=A0A9J7L0R1_BRAFL|nr:uncharacterized protein LOC118413659 [Branchiostoma floridae]